MNESPQSDNSAKKIVLEELTKEEIIEKYQNALGILKKAKQAKDVIVKENNELKERLSQTEKHQVATNEIIENLTQQKLELVTSLEDVKSQKNALNERLSNYQTELAVAENKVSQLEAAGECYKRQVNRLTDENEQLITHLDTLENQIEELKEAGIQQQQQLLELEKANKDLLEKSTNISEKKMNQMQNQVVELQQMLNISLEEVKNLKSEVDSKNQKIDDLVMVCAEKDHNIVIIGNELTKCKKNVDDLDQLLEQTKEECEAIRKQNAELELQKTENVNENNLTSEIESNKITIDTLQKEIQEYKEKLRDSSDSQVLNEKLREKIKLYHTKMIKFAGDIKSLKNTKNAVLDNFKLYTEQVENWKKQLNDISNRLLQNVNACEFEKQQQKKIIDKQEEELKELKDKLNMEFKKQTDCENTTSQMLDEKCLELKKLQDDLIEEKKKTEENVLKLQEISGQLEEKKLELNKISEEVTLIREHNNALTEKIDVKEKEIEELKGHNSNLQIIYDESDKIKQENNEYKESIAKHLKELSDRENKIIEMRTDIDDLNSKLEKMSIELEEVRKINRELNQNLNQHRIETTDAHHQTDATVDEVKNYEDKILYLQSENHELLSEMNEMNQVLKERGETISKQQVYCEELLKKVQTYEDQCSKQNEALAEKEHQMNGLQKEITVLKDKTQKTEQTDIENNDLKAKENLISQLQNEIQSLKERINNNAEACHDSSYAESETMSTSTVSKADELNRLKDLEGPWEERYGKLRSLAIKQKGKIRELSADLAKEQGEKNELQTKCTNAVKTIQSLQQQCDKTQDELEVCKKEKSNYIKQMDSIAADSAKDKQALANNKETIAKLKSEIEAFSKEKTNVESWKKQVGLKVQSLKKELEANAVLKKDFENQIKQLQSEMEAKEKALKIELEKHNQTKSSLIDSNNECKKQTVLNLEMQDYERSIKDLSQKLEKKQDLINKLKNQLDSQKSSLSSLKDQNKLLEDQMRTSEKEVESAKLEVNILKVKINELDSVLLEKDAAIQGLTENLETVRGENEELSTQLSTIVAEHQKAMSLLKSDKEHLRSQNLGLEQRLRETQDCLKLKVDELKNIQSEYHGYKVRAQSVLRQNQTRDIGLEEKLTEEAESHKAQVEILKIDIIDLKNSLEKLNAENRALSTSNENLTKECSDLKNELEKCKHQYDQLSKKHEQTIIENSETIRNLKIHAETLSTCYRQQVAEQEVRHNREIIELQSKIVKAIPTPEIPPLVPPTMPREEGEGSESVESSAPSIHPIPLERLLSVSSDQDTNLLKKHLAENESKVAHLTALLADTEQDLVKHVQMNKLLKEEIRRQQRSVEREQHAENLEYLKNVMFKFITLSNGDERTRLVPVLTTILKLSPEETHKLNLVAKSDKGWSNYLPLWPSTKPQ